MGFHPTPEEQLKRVEQRVVILDGIEAGDVEQTPRWTLSTFCRNEREAIDSERNRARGAAICRCETSLILRAHSHLRSEPRRQLHGQSLARPQLGAIRDIGERDEFAAVAGHHRWYFQP